MLSASRPGHNNTRNKQHFKFLSRSVPKNYKQGSDNNDDDDDDDDDDDFDIAITNRNHPTPPIQTLYRRSRTVEQGKQYPTRLRNRPAYFNEQHYM